jgi:acyl carrier protein
MGADSFIKFKEESRTMNQEIYNVVKSIIVSYLRLNEDEVTPETHIVNDIGADSLALVELAFKFCDRFQIPMMTPAEELFIIRNLVRHIESEINAKQAVA